MRHFKLNVCRDRAFHTFCLPLSALDVGVGVWLLVYPEDPVDGVGRMPERRGIRRQRGPGPGPVAGYLGLLRSLVPDDSEILFCIY